MDKQYSDLTQEEKDNLHSKCCEGTNEEQAELVDSVFPSDTFIEMKIEEFHRKYDFSENETLEYDNLIGIADFLKSSLQEQRQSILEEIEKKILELIAYSSFDITCGGEVKDRNCTVEEAMHELSKDVEQLFKNYKVLEEKGYKIVKK